MIRSSLWAHALGRKGVGEIVDGGEGGGNVGGGTSSEWIRVMLICCPVSRADSFLLFFGKDAKKMRRVGSLGTYICN